MRFVCLRLDYVAFHYNKVQRVLIIYSLIRWGSLQSQFIKSIEVIGYSFQKNALIRGLLQVRRYLCQVDGYTPGGRVRIAGIQGLAARSFEH